MPTDPVCRRRVSENTPFKEELEGITYYFCSEDCREQFEQLEEEQALLRGPYPSRPDTED